MRIRSRRLFGSLPVSGQLVAQGWKPLRPYPESVTMPMN